MMNRNRGTGGDGAVRCSAWLGGVVAALYPNIVANSSKSLEALLNDAANRARSGTDQSRHDLQLLLQTIESHLAAEASTHHRRSK